MRIWFWLLISAVILWWLWQYPWGQVIVVAVILKELYDKKLV